MKRIAYLLLAALLLAACNTESAKEPEYIVQVSLGGWHSPDYTAEQYADVIFRGEYMNHFYTSLPEGYYLDGYTHTPLGQAKFFEDLIPKLLAKDYIIGTVIYCWSDSDRCYVCGQSDCPVETGWGLVDGDGNRKPSFYAVKEIFNSTDR